MDYSRAGLPVLIEPAADLHLHSTASDGALGPDEIVRRAAEVGLALLALTDHDTLAGITAATHAGNAVGVAILSGCELSVRGPLGELHLLVYGIPPGEVEFGAVLGRARDARAVRGRTMLDRLAALGVMLSAQELERQAAGAPIGRPHVARALIARGVVRTIDEAFDRFLGRGRPCFVPKSLPELEEITALVRRIGGVTSAAHLAGRGAGVAGQLAERGVDGLEVIHPRHTEAVRRELRAAADAHGLLPTGGSDWHGGDAAGPKHGRLGDVRVPLGWARALEQLIGSRRGG